MTMRTEEAYNRMRELLFASPEEVDNQLSPKQQEQRRRLQLAITHLLDNPHLAESKIVAFLRDGCGGELHPISQSQAYRDLADIYRMVGAIKMASKEWHRHIVVEMAKEAFDTAKTAGDAKGMAAAANTIGKYMQLDKDTSDMQWDKMTPPAFIPSSDPILLEGCKFKSRKELEERRKWLRRQLGGATVEAEIVSEDAEYR